LAISIQKVGAAEDSSWGVYERAAAATIPIQKILMALKRSTFQRIIAIPSSVAQKFHQSTLLFKDTDEQFKRQRKKRAAIVHAFTLYVSGYAGSRCAKNEL